MAVQNSLAKKTGSQKSEEVQYLANGKQVTLSLNTVKNYLVSGDKERVTTQEIVMFINLCKFTGLNPWLREAYCIKYGNEPATLVVGKEAFFKRAENNENYDGLDAGIVVMDASGEFIYRKGTMKIPDEQIIGGWAEVYRKDRNHSFRIEVSFDEYAGRKKDGTLNSQWSKKPATMIRKVAVVQALREAFPNTFEGMYVAEEQGASEPEYVASDVIEAPQTEQEPVQEAPVSQQDAEASFFS